MITMLMSALLLLAIGVVLFDTERSLKAMYDRASSDVVAEAYMARAGFEGAVRPSTMRACAVGGSGESLEVYYYAGAPRRTSTGTLPSTVRETSSRSTTGRWPRGHSRKKRRRRRRPWRTT